MLVENEFQYTLSEVNLHFSQMNHLAENIVVTAIVLLAGVYLARLYLLPRIRKNQAESPCTGSSCNCPSAKPKAFER